ncbi:hypothetical protein Patl1_16023 [Pistacia atlantica]|uniref:Uncharacterized protein n=1 Tax=Pistacia atlantica TaxID=434234 RepID=A0ACC1B860_9ROSI|nr:hypothetical protein Patl1_16023 [Pistacia atlantica]
MYPSSTLNSPAPFQSSLFTKPIAAHRTPKLKITNIQTKRPSASETVSTTKYRLQLLASEFSSLTEPIDRVKRLLDYAAVLPALDESARVQENRVTGCTTQVWLDVVMDEKGKMRFRADSDSEISKGFCSCLIMVLDGSEPEEVLGVKTEDLTEMNVGVHGKAVSRVNTWHNVLIVMQKRTRFLVTEQKQGALAGCSFR